MGSEALEHLSDAETALISYMTQLMEVDEDDEAPNSFTMMMAVLRSVSRASGILQALEPAYQQLYQPRVRIMSSDDDMGGVFYCSHCGAVTHLDADGSIIEVVTPSHPQHD